MTTPMGTIGTPSATLPSLEERRQIACQAIPEWPAADLERRSIWLVDKASGTLYRERRDFIQDSSGRLVVNVRPAPDGFYVSDDGALVFFSKNEGPATWQELVTLREEKHRQRDEAMAARRRKRGRRRR